MIFFILQFDGISKKLLAGELYQEDSEDTTSQLARDARHFVETGLGLFSAPLMFDSRDWTRFGLVTGGTALLFTADKSIKSFALRNQNNLNDRIFDTDRFWGNKYALFTAWGIYGYGALSGNNTVRKVGLNATEAFIYSGIITGLIKVLIGRRRPYAGNDHLFLHPLQFTNNDYLALPSGHATVSFAVSTVLAKSVDNTFWKVFWYGSAGLVCASRVYHNKHWFSDVFLGAAIGYTVADYVVHFERKEESQEFGINARPYFGLNKIGIQLYWN